MLSELEQLETAAIQLSEQAKNKGEPYWEQVWLEESKKIREEINLIIIQPYY